MIILCVYDISVENKGESRLRKIAKYCENVGIRIQNSVFEINCTPAEYIKIKYELSFLIDYDYDTIRLYNLGRDASNKIESIGLEPKLDTNKDFII